MKKHKVAIITNIPSPYRIPLFEKIAEKVDLCVYFTMIDESETDWEFKFSDKFNYKILPHYNLKYRGKDLLNYHFNPSIFTELMKNDYDVVILGGYMSLTAKITLIICKMKKIPLILWSGTTLYEKSFLKTMAMPVIKAMIKKMDAFVVYGSRAKEYIQSFGIPEEKIYMAINVGDVDFFSRESEKLSQKKEMMKKEIGIKTKKNILFVGRLIPIKGLKYLLKSYEMFKKEFKDIGLIIVGNGPLKEKLTSKYGHLDNVYFVDFVQPPMLPVYYNIADVFVLPSTYELFSIATSEAIASQLPVITTNKNGASVDIVKQGINGFIVQDKSYKEIYRAMKKIFCDDELLKQMGRESKKMIEEEFNLDKTTGGFLEAMKYVLEVKE